MVRFLAPIDLNQNELKNALIHKLSSAPGTPVEGQVYYDTTAHKLYYRTNTAWYDVTDALTLQGQAGSYYLARANHTGTQTASTVSDFDTQVRTSRLDQMAAPTASVSLNSQKITNLATPTSATDGANKGYVDAIKTGLDFKDSVRVASTANLTLSGTQTIDGIAVVVGNRVLAKNQTTASQNGIWVVTSGAWARSTDADEDVEVTGGMFVFVEEGTSNADTGWVLSTDGAITVGTTSLTFTQFSAAGIITAGAGLTKTGNSLAVNIDGVTIYLNANNLTVKSSATAKQTLVSDGASGPATWGAVDLGVPAAITGTLPIGNGGTGGTTAATARANLGATTKYATDIGDGASTSIVVTHNLNTRDVIVKVRDNTTPFDFSEVTTSATTANTVTLTFTTAPTTNQLRAIVIG